MAMFAALGYEHAFKHAYKDTATYILLYYPIPLSIGIVGKYIARKMHAPIEIIFTGLMIISLGALIFVFVFAQKGVI
ncbi:MAG: hypothetical protein CMN56_04660 [Sneathiella sp.]|mgnify:FL=1|nr:hypothetical protein [Sneathiella sp.]